MTLVLVVDDMAVIREPVAAALRGAGYEVVCAAEGREALARARERVPDAILLDLSMPGVDGMTVLRALRASPDTARTPVLLLTASADRDKVLQAAKYGVHDYVLKSRFSLNDLLDRLHKHIGSAAPAPAVPATAAPPAAPAPAAPADEHAGKILDRDACIARARGAVQTSALSGVVGQVIGLAASPRSDLSQLADLIARDPMLSARVLQAANTAAYASTRGLVTTIHEAIRNIGSATVRNIAAALSIFDAMPATDATGFNPIRCWQHSFAVAQLCERLCAPVDPDSASCAYLVGLCHDLGEVLFRTHFANEYQPVLDAHARTGRPLEALERTMLGITRGELSLIILRHLALPDSILAPIEALHRPGGPGRAADRVTRVLALSDAYANGVLLASSTASPVAPFAHAACKQAVDVPHPACPDPAAMRAEIFSLTALLGRLSAKDEKALMQPLCAQSELRVCLVRDARLSSFDPVAAALGSLAQVQTRKVLPAAADFADFDALVVCAASAASSGLTGHEIDGCLNAAGRQQVPLLWLLPDEPDTASVSAGAHRPKTYPVPLATLVAFVDTAQKTLRAAA
jgi:CheY-like chemotaxis protein